MVSAKTISRSSQHGAPAVRAARLLFARRLLFTQSDVCEPHERRLLFTQRNEARSGRLGRLRW